MVVDIKIDNTMCDNNEIEQEIIEFYNDNYDNEENDEYMAKSE